MPRVRSAQTRVLNLTLRVQSVPRRFKAAFNTAMLSRVCFTLLAAGRATTTRCCRTACTTAIAPWTPRSAGPPFPSPRRRPRAHSPVHDCKPAVPPVQKSCVDPDSRLLPRAEWHELHPEIQSDIFITRLIVVPEHATLTPKPSSRARARYIKCGAQFSLFTPRAMEPIQLRN